MHCGFDPKTLANAVASKHLAETLDYGLPIAEAIGLVAVDVARARNRPATSELLDVFIRLKAVQRTSEAQVLLETFETCRTTELLSYEEAGYLLGLAIGAAVRGQV